MIHTTYNMKRKLQSLQSEAKIQKICNDQIIETVSDHSHMNYIEAIQIKFESKNTKSCNSILLGESIPRKKNTMVK